jgi:hypothetical protein
MHNLGFDFAHFHTLSLDMRLPRLLLSSLVIFTAIINTPSTMAQPASKPTNNLSAKVKANAVALANPSAGALSKSGLSDDWVHGPFIEIFVRAYADSNGDGIGDLKGLTSKLD